MPDATADPWPPRWLSPSVEADSDGALVVEFIESMCRSTKDTRASLAGDHLDLRPWQHDLLTGLFSRRPDGRRRYRQALVGMPRKNGKSCLGAGIALYGLVMEGHGAEVYSCAADREQARIVFGMAKRMVELEPELAAVVRPYRDALEVPSTGSVYRVLSAEAYTKEGLSPSIVVFDEVHAQPTDELWNVMTLGSAARVDPLVLGITTAGVRTDSSGRDSLCFRMYEHGRRVATGEVVDPSFFFAWWEPADPTADHTDPATWAASNPGYGDLVDPEDFASVVLRTPEAEFRTKRTNLFVASTTTWLPHGAWDRCADLERAIPPGAEVVLGFDGSFNNDSTALVVCTTGEVPHLDVVAAWERPGDARIDWQVPILDVEDAIRQACRRWQVRELACDPYRWARTYQILEGEGLPVVEFPQSPARMVPATARMYEAVVNNTITHSGDPRLARHVGNAVLRIDSRGARLSKEHRESNRKIDLAVSAVMALDRASQRYEPPIDVSQNIW